MKRSWIIPHQLAKSFHVYVMAFHGGKNRYIAYFSNKVVQIINTVHQKVFACDMLKVVNVNNICYSEVTNVFVLQCLKS